MLVAINQPNYIPWRGYFDIIDDVDLFLFFDDVQYTLRDWRNRNRIKTKNGPVWLTVPVIGATRESLINEVRIDYGQNWQTSHKRQIIEAYRAAPYYDLYAEGFFEILDRGYEKLVDLTIDSTLFVMKALDIRTPTRRTSELNVTGQKTDRLLGILEAVGGRAYLSGPAAKAYIDPALFKHKDIGLWWKAYEYEAYPQRGNTFEPEVSVLDLLFNCGPDARKWLKSSQRSEKEI